MKIRTRSVPNAYSSCCVPCQSMSNKMSRPAFERFLDRLLGAAVAMVEDIGPFGKIVGVDHRVECRLVDEMIVASVDFARGAWRGWWR